MASLAELAAQAAAKTTGTTINVSTADTNSLKSKSGSGK